jgi:two-component system, cell cycle sensor histidine kinase and response regulator CckA
MAILDLVMPKMGGTETAAKLTARFGKLPILFTSGYSQESKGFDAASPSARYLQKPYSPSNLSRIVREILDQVKAAPSAP